jgi:hypothetical protein
VVQPLQNILKIKVKDKAFLNLNLKDAHVNRYFFGRAPAGQAIHFTSRRFALVVLAPILHAKKLR